MAIKEILSRTVSRGTVKKKATKLQSSVSDKSTAFSWLTRLPKIEVRGPAAIPNRFLTPLCFRSCIVIFFLCYTREPQEIVSPPVEMRKVTVSRGIIFGLEGVLVFKCQ